VENLFHCDLKYVLFDIFMNSIIFNDIYVLIDLVPKSSKVDSLEESEVHEDGVITDSSTAEINGDIFQWLKSFSVPKGWGRFVTADEKYVSLHCLAAEVIHDILWYLLLHFCMLWHHLILLYLMVSHLVLMYLL